MRVTRSAFLDATTAVAKAMESGNGSGPLDIVDRVIRDVDRTHKQPIAGLRHAYSSDCPVCEKLSVLGRVRRELTELEGRE